MATATELARKLYPRMATGGGSSNQAGAPAPRSELGQIARRLYPAMKSAGAPPPPPRTERAGFFKKVLACHMTGPARGQLYYVDVPLSGTR
jgi:hypothetical protein